ncbi:MAG: class I SAM-dependent methyltransferase [Methanomassiliicoccus sp.]|nr:MAG: class I SAM-dependent methyltransferase [Methanomassiliicoccus sp.]
MSWDSEYVLNRRPWGNNPSELALIAAAHLRELPLLAKKPRIIDIGCGYGRDTFYLSDQLGLPVLGIDNSETAIGAAMSATSKGRTNVSFTCQDFRDIKDEFFGVCFASNLYHLLNHSDRKEFQRKIQSLMGDGSLLFLNALSVNDREEYGKGAPVPGDVNSFVGDKYLHFFTRRELLDDFWFLDVRELYEHSYDEPHENGPTHHHMSWILIGEPKPIE